MATSKIVLFPSWQKIKTEYEKDSQHSTVSEKYMDDLLLSVRFWNVHQG